MVLAGRVAPLLLLAVLAACGSEDGAPAPAAAPVPRPTAVPGADGPVTTVHAATVLEGSGRSSPELCLGMLAESHPPQCGGIPLEGWAWEDHAGRYESSAGVRWGEFAVTGTFDGETMVVTDVVPGDDAPPYPRDGLLGTPCPEPDGGWRVLDPELTTEASMSETYGRAALLPSYSQAWMDQSINAAYDPSGTIGPEDVERLNDPEKLILNVAVTGDLATAEAELRETWGGALCVSRGLVTERRRLEIQGEMVEQTFGFLGGMGGGGTRPLEMDVVHDDGSIQAWVDQEYGDGVVVVRSRLRPVG